MSRKRKYNRAAADRRAPVQEQPIKKINMPAVLRLIAQDGYTNALAHLGEASDTSASNGFERNSISRDYELLTVMYRENWIAKRIIDTPCEDMTRSWYSVVSKLNQNKLDELEKLEARHNIKQEITNGLRWARLYGGAAAVMVIKGQEDMLDRPLDYDDLMPGCFRGLIIVDRTNGLDPSVELEDDMDDPEFGYPKYYTVTLNDDNRNTVRVHHSRLLIFRGRMLPLVEEMTESYWGASELEHVYEELQKRNATSANIAQLIFQANVGALKMADYGEVMGMGTEAQKQQILDAIYAENRMRTSFGMMIMGNEDSYEQHPYSFSGLSEVYETFMMDMAGAAEIPATKLYGRAPQGMNATGESDMKNYYEMLAQLQERNLRPVIEKLLPVMAVSLWGKIPNDMKVVFEPLEVTTPAERAQIMQQVTGVVIQAYSAGLIAQRPALIELQKFGKDIGFWESITDEMIEKAETEVDNGEGEGDPMGGMGGMMPGGPEGPGGPGGGPGGGMDPMAMMGGAPEEEGAPEGAPPEAPEQPEEANEKAPQEGQNNAKPAPEGQDDEILRQILKEAENGKKADSEENAEDGGPGSGNFGHPGYRRGGGIAPAGGEQKAGIGERLRFIQDPTEGKNAPRGAYYGPTGSKSHVEQMNRERKQWGELSLRQKIKGNSEQQKHMAKMKASVIKAAAKGDLDTARKIVRANRHYFSNDPVSTEKVQSETLKRQRAVKPLRFMHDLLDRLPFRKKTDEPAAKGKLIKAYAKDHSGDETAEFILRLYGLDEEAWRTSEEGRHFKLETSTGEIKAGFGGKFNGKKIGEQWTPTSGSEPRAKGTKVAAPPKVTPPKAKMPDVPVSFNETSTGHLRSKEVAAQTASNYKESLNEAKAVFNDPNSSMDQRDESLNYLIATAAGSDQWIHAERGDAPSIDDFGLGKVPREWAARLTPVEQDVLAKISEETDGLNYIESESWYKKNESAANVQMALQAKLLGAEVDAKIPADILEKYAGIEERREVPGQQSMFWGENVPMAERPTEAGSQSPGLAEAPAAYDPQNNSSENPDKGSETRYNESGTGSGRAKAPLNLDYFQTTEPQKFYDTFHAAKKAVQDVQPDKSWRVDGTYSVEDYAKMQCFTTKGGSAVAVHDGDIVSVCKHPGDRGVTGSQLLEFARMKGGNKLDAFGGLYEFYTKNGFEPTSYCEFADIEGIRPPDWDRTRDQKEPVVFFKYTGHSREEIWKAHGKNCDEYVASHKPEEDYSKAKKIRDDSMEV